MCTHTHKRGTHYTYHQADRLSRPKHTKDTRQGETDYENTGVHTPACAHTQETSDMYKPQAGIYTHTATQLHKHRQKDTERGNTCSHGDNLITNGYISS